MRIEDRVFIVTGAASGLGAATAALLVSGGGRVVCVDINDAAGEAIAGRLGAPACFVRADSTSETDGKAVIQVARKAFGAIHGLINCAGVAPGEKILSRRGVHRLESFVRTLTINLAGTFNMLRLAAAAMVEAQPGEDGERGVIINTASVAAFEGQIGQCAYSASKGGVAAMTLPAARELAQFGVRVVAIAPGVFETPMFSAMPAEVQASLGQSVPFPSRLGKPSEFAQLVGHIIENRMINGEIIRLDGALRMAAH